LKISTNKTNIEKNIKPKINLPTRYQKNKNKIYEKSKHSKMTEKLTKLLTEVSKLPGAKNNLESKLLVSQLQVPELFSADIT